MEHISHPMQVKVGDKETVGSYQLQYYTAKEALNKGIKMALVTFGAAIFSIVLPGVHFVSVPLGILASPLVGAYIYKTRKDAAKSMTGSFVCPECHVENHVAAPRVLSHYESHCVQCGHEVRLIPE